MNVHRRRWGWPSVSVHHWRWGRPHVSTSHAHWRGGHVHPGQKPARREDPSRRHRRRRHAASLVAWSHLTWPGRKHGVGPLLAQAPVLVRQEPLRRRAVPLPPRVLLEGIAHRDWPVVQELAVHGFYSGVGRLKSPEAHEAKASGLARVGVPRHLGRLRHHSKGRERVVQILLVHLAVQIPHEEVGAHVRKAFVLRRLVHLDGHAVQLQHVEDLHGVVRILLPLELHKAIALVCSRYPVLGQIHVHQRTCLDKDLPKDLLGDLALEVPDVTRRILVPVVMVLAQQVRTRSGGDPPPRGRHLLSPSIPLRKGAAEPREKG
mmetsp:Transcript_7843/g.22447  ORF Transcript_7843/g.22447 Transcript_7843/m.22447 type:complete len:319 (+) Transcript_7843:3226-4182(+)